MPEVPPADDASREPDAEQPAGLSAREEAERAATEAAERARAARERAEALRRLAEQTLAAAERRGGGPLLDPETAAAAPAAERRRLPWRPVAAGFAALAVTGLTAAAGAMFWTHRVADTRAQRVAEYTAIARQGVINLMSLDYNDAKGSVARILDSSTGRLHDQYAEHADALAENLQKSKIVTVVTIGVVAVETLSPDSAVVLVSTKSQATNVKDGRLEPEDFRIAVTLQRDGGQMKIADLDFI
ncbi:hypothetical protein MINS_35450 [Mycolicibacterium insubricum]|uniref:Uncharacterized protein n=1 Tax=Mycolicibacterium insubricum TaxID=444597 RepID=A0A1X0CZU6_9MYCO|nr:hypothetical protein [Mycolicibacterium insubricum]ORA65030.1 hypothetical protein BST26_19210 [Mycolicibacterium insubricum]BBZ68116.1 hypothetical protein MINS_35450 [Mycolicibacterium insubricum]